MYRVRKIVYCNEAHERHCYGNGISVAILDSGIYPHVDFGNRIVSFRDFVNHSREIYDDNGHGSHIAGIVGASGRASHGKYCGMAPECSFFIGKVLDYEGNGNMADILDGIDWVIANRDRYHIRILNVSVGTTAKIQREEDYCLVEAVERAWEAGIVVVAAAGNNGPKESSITIPGISRKIITVGCSDDYIPVYMNGSKKRDYSGRGPTLECICKPDMVAPGNQIVSTRNNLSGYFVKSGTSMATPVVTGATALLLERYPYFTPKEVKKRLLFSATDLGLPRNKQGWGILNVWKMLYG